MDKKPVYEFAGEYRFLSNFWPCFIEYQGLTYPSVENAYQAAKMFDIEDRVKFTNIKASEAKRLGKVLPMREDWDSTKRVVMFELVWQKFSKNVDLKAALLATGLRELQEGNWWGDTYWGTVNGKGDNHLGKILMRVREDLACDHTRNR